MNFVAAPDGARLAYTDEGRGPPLICLAGLTRNMDAFLPVRDRFVDRARVIRMDYRGRGASDHSGPETYTIPQEARDLLTLMDALGLDDAAILGTSRGGLVAMATAMLAPARVRGVIFNDVGPELMPEGLAHILEYIGKPPPFRSLDAAAAAFPALHAPAFRNVPPATWAAHARQLFREEDGRLHLRYDPRLREAVAAAFAPGAVPPDMWPAFDALAGKPLGLVRGAGSNILSAGTAAKMRARRPDMAYACIADRGHVPFLDEPPAVEVIAAVLGPLA